MMHLNYYGNLSPVRKWPEMKKESAFLDPNHKVIHLKRLKFLVIYLGSWLNLSLGTREKKTAKETAFSDRKRLVLSENYLHIRLELCLMTRKKIKTVKETAVFDPKQPTPSMLNRDSSPHLSPGTKM